MNLSFIATRRNLIYTYIVYWVLYFVFFWLIESSYNQDYYHAFAADLAGLPLKILFVSMVLEWLMEHYLFHKKAVRFVLLFIPLLFLFAYLQRLVDNYIIIDYINPVWTKESLINSPAYIYNILKFAFAAAIPFNIKLFAQWSMEQNKAQNAAAEKMQTELNFLRNQFHPHFIFNVLNSLYSKILRGSGDAADIVLKISSLLRFTIYDINAKTIPLDKEIDYLKDYIALQRIRYDKRLELSFSIDGSTENKIIEPFLLIPFIENSFKYCISGDTETGWITINISINSNWLIFKIENSLPGNNNRDKQMEYGPLNDRGVGLENVKKRLQLLYADMHQLKITKDEDSFFVLLKLKLHEHDR